MSWSQQQRLAPALWLRVDSGQALPRPLIRPPCSSAYDARLRQKVAVKKLSRPFQSLIHARRTYRELRLLKHLKHENVRGQASGVGTGQRTPPGGGGSEEIGAGPLGDTPHTWAGPRPARRCLQLNCGPASSVP